MENLNFKFCPNGPDFKVDWELIESSFEWFRRLKHVKQDPVHHKEGDVFTHTKKVCDNLVKLPEWRNLDVNDRIVLFVGALMHDIAKPFCSYESNGRITTKGHEMKGELITRSTIYRNQDKLYNFPIKYREKIAKMVRYHSLPLNIMNFEDPQKELLKVSQMIKLEHLEILAKADVLGRVCNDSDKLIEKIKVFKNYCIENECYNTEWSFKNNFSRFMYFYKDSYLASFEVTDDTKFEILMMVGLPSSGKDAYIERYLADHPVVSLDSIREELDFNPKEAQSKTIQNAKEKAREYMRDRISFVWNATNITKTLRTQIIKFFIDYGAKIKICYIEAPYEEILQRNAAQEKMIPEKVMEKLINKFEVPDFTEAHIVEIYEDK